MATSLGDTWDGTSSTRLSVLKENAADKTLQTVKTIDGIGLKGEQLYAARFLGDRGYLVTFRVTDPVVGTGYLDLQVTYTQPTDLLFVPGPTISVSRTKRVWVAS